ncbi:hypothetical protein J6590_068449 [Homalodisca vitripennis]|nr:hypothetical protein J6590_068449 [Homalodisca vitripennis]
MDLQAQTVVYLHDQSLCRFNELSPFWTSLQIYKHRMLCTFTINLCADSMSSRHSGRPTDLQAQNVVYLHDQSLCRFNELSPFWTSLQIYKHRMLCTFTINLCADSMSSRHSGRPYRSTSTECCVPSRSISVPIQ